MNKLFVGNVLTGNFRPIKEYQKNIHDYKVEKIDGSLRLTNGLENIRLEPVGDGDNLVVNNFSNEIGEMNESIYRLESKGKLVVLILYVYSSVCKLLLNDQKFIIHLSRVAEKQICGDPKGYSGLKLGSPDEIVPLLSSMFMNNKSIFVQIIKGGYQMFGNGYRADIKEERSGIYVIDKLVKHPNKEYSFALTQIFGNVNFALWKDSLGIKSNGHSFQNVQTNEVFKAWDEYMDFEQEIYNNTLDDFGFISYSNIEVDGDKMIFNLKENIEEKKAQNIEFEFISSFMNGKHKNAPTTTEEIHLLKDSDKKASIYLGKCINDGVFDNKLIFNIPKYGFYDFSGRDLNDLKTHDGILYVSDFGLQIEQKRRRKVLAKIDSKTNESANIIMKLSDKDVVDNQLGTLYNPINDVVLRKMFGNPNVKLKETYREAMSIALNTPDIALIQGPPGTGKTTLIKGLITRINMMNKNYKILVSSEQHEALFNVVDKLSENKFIPPFVSSKMFDSDTNDEDDQHFEKNVREFQQNFASACNDVLGEINKRDSRSLLITECVYIIQDIKENYFSKEYIATRIDDLKTKIIELGCYERFANDFADLYQCINDQSLDIDQEELDFTIKNIIRKIECQRTVWEAYIDDGKRQLIDLQKLLERNGYSQFLLDKNVFDRLVSCNEFDSDLFDRYIQYVETLKDKFIPREANEFNDKIFDAKQIVHSIFMKISEVSKEKPKDFYEIVETLLYRLNDMDAVGETVKKYTSVIGSTCAQAGRSGDIADLSNNKFDFVIIDEAARANPLDIMIPMMMGARVILVGDHKQLPHYIETNYLSRFKSEKNRYSKYDETLLTKSLFQIIYENLDKAYKDGRIKYKRTIQIDEQHRMHPSIGTFISNEFYNGTIKNGEETINKINDYNVLDNKNIAWINVDLFKGTESKKEQSYVRKVEVERIVLLIEELIKKNPGRKLNIGIISFYKGQVGLIKEILEEKFPKSELENIYCNTVDSYQGKEFDIVILSGVRSNNFTTSERSLGFIDHSASRINVALSRAKRLLIIVADAGTYKRTEHFRNFIKYVKENGYYGK